MGVEGWCELNHGVSLLETSALENTNDNSQRCEMLQAGHHPMACCEVYTTGTWPLCYQA